MHVKKLVIATHNKAKFEQLKSFLSQLPIDCYSLSDLHISFEVDETGTTYAENAVLKAASYAELAQLPTLADDGGLEIAALDGAPGLYTSRFAGANKTDEEKVLFLLEKMKHVPIDQRQAQFVCAVVLSLPEEKPRIYEGVLRGSIATELRGTFKKGIPYYSVFIPEGFDNTIAELLDKGIPYTSHRAKAMKLLLDDLNN